ncbi:metal ABC transporter substrate-binding protein [Candidatus Solirubrobacter pratensis]|uniref:metal ABC transporter substrate-binding protein n=1 Tax=Candidatus Solirubrobacter pratensis TaxID=1298857 RepID=UPI00040DCD2C|nr:metal ABC transporter substrate-binding protein [Candidatus Solirubrobacter pratensis]
MPVRPALIAAALAVAVSGCGGSDQDSESAASAGASSSSKPIAVVATTTQLGDIVREVGGPSVDVHQILQPNSDPHDYEPRPADVQAAAGAKLVVESGNNLDKWMGEVVSEAGGHPAVLAIAPEQTPYTVPGESSGPEASKFDPHWWHDPRNVEAAVAAVRDALVQAEPGNARALRRSADGYLAKVKALDAGIASCFAAVPAGQRKLVTSHDAFNYFAKRYGITVVGAVIPSQSTQAQPSAGQISKLAKLVEQEGVKAVYPESSLNPKLADAIAKQTGARADYTLYGDTLGPAGSSGDTYLHMEQANADAMVRGFTGGARGCTIAGL